MQAKVECDKDLRRGSGVKWGFRGGSLSWQMVEDSFGKSFLEKVNATQNGLKAWKNFARQWYKEGKLAFRIQGKLSSRKTPVFPEEVITGEQLDQGTQLGQGTCQVVMWAGGKRAGAPGKPVHLTPLQQETSWDAQNAKRWVRASGLRKTEPFTRTLV